MHTQTDKPTTVTLAAHARRRLNTYCGTVVFLCCNASQACFAYVTRSGKRYHLAQKFKIALRVSFESTTHAAYKGLLQDHQGGSWERTASCWLPQDAWEDTESKIGTQVKNMYDHFQISSMYYGVPRSAVIKFTSLCASFQLRQPQISRAPLKPIIAKGFLSRLQVRTWLCVHAGNNV